MNFRHPFELGLAQFSPILLFEPSRGVLQTRPEATFLHLFYKSVTHYSLEPPHKTSETLESSEICHLDFSVSSRWGEKQGVRLTYSPYRLLSRFPICLPVFFKQARHTDIYLHTHTQRKRHPHTALCAPHICPG